MKVVTPSSCAVLTSPGLLRPLQTIVLRFRSALFLKTQSRTSNPATSGQIQIKHEQIRDWILQPIGERRVRVQIGNRCFSVGNEAKIMEALQPVDGSFQKYNIVLIVLCHEHELVNPGIHLTVVNPVSQPVAVHCPGSALTYARSLCFACGKLNRELPFAFTVNCPDILPLVTQ
jgi:hypothetical protein